MPITPDTKDWTWVLQSPCSDCGFDPVVIDDAAITDLVRRHATSWHAVLRDPLAAQRPDDSTWSPLEYAGHLRDVYRLFRDRLQLMLTENDPVFPSWDQDEASVALRYNEQAPSLMEEELVDAAATLADTLAAVPPNAWDRTGRRSDGMRFTVSSFARYLLHEQVHHLWDVQGERFPMT